MNNTWFDDDNLFLLELISEKYTDAQKKQLGIPPNAEARGGKWFVGDTYAGKVIKGKFIPASVQDEPETSKPQGKPSDKPSTPSKTIHQAAKKLSSVQSYLVDKQFTSQEITQFEQEFGIDVNRVLSDPSTYEIVAGKDDSGRSPEEIMQHFKDQMYFVVRGGNTQDAYDIGKFQQAFPLKYKDLDDAQARAAVQKQLDNPTSVSEKLTQITRQADSEHTTRQEDKQKTKTQQSEWVAKQDKQYDSDMIGWQRSIDKDALKRIDQRLIDDPPPPIQTSVPVYRGMAMSKQQLTEFLEQFRQSEVTLPVGAYTFEPSVASDFADTQVSHGYRPNVTVSDENQHAVIMRIRGQNNSLNGFYMNSNQSRDGLKDEAIRYSDQHEVLLPSNQRYTVENVTASDFGGRKVVIIDLVQRNT